MKRHFLLAASCVLMSGALNAETITIHGSTTVDGALFKPHKAALEAATGDTYRVVGNGSSRGIKGVDSGAAKVGMISSGFDSTMAKLKMTERAGEFNHVKVGESVATFAVHPDNPVSELTKEQVVKILTGQIVTWADVGGSNIPITIVTEYDGGGLRSTIEKKVLDKAKISGIGIKELPTANLIPQTVAASPEAFATISQAQLKSSELKRIKTDADVIQPLILVVKGAPTPEFERLVDASKEVLK